VESEAYGAGDNRDEQQTNQHALPRSMRLDDKLHSGSCCESAGSFRVDEMRIRNSPAEKVVFTDT
jgi:hypothetical protein